MKTVWVLGSLNMDTTYNVGALPREGMTVRACACSRAVGGKGFNQAVAASRCGAPTRLIGAVGDDGDGHALLQAAAGQGVDTRYVFRLDRENTGAAVVLVEASGANLIVVHGGANLCVPRSAAPFAPGDLVAAQLETDPHTVAYYFSLAKEAGAVTVLNPSPFTPLSAGLIAATDLMVANEHEAAAFAGLDPQTAAPEQLARAVCQRGIARAVVTLGGQGAAVLDGDTFSRIPGRAVPVVDTQGAGDAFLGTLACRLVQGHSLAEAARFANLVAADCVGRAGSTLASYPDEERLALLQTLLDREVDQ